MRGMKLELLRKSSGPLVLKALASGLLYEAGGSNRIGPVARGNGQVSPGLMTESWHRVSLTIASPLQAS